MKKFENYTDVPKNSLAYIQSDFNIIILIISLKTKIYSKLIFKLDIVNDNHWLMRRQEKTGLSTKLFQQIINDQEMTPELLKEIMYYEYILTEVNRKTTYNYILDLSTNQTSP